MSKPTVILPACSQQIGHHLQHTAQFKYVAAVVDGAACSPLILPAIGAATDYEAVIGACHGILLTGSPSNVHPSHYGQAVRDHSLPQDVARDATIFPLIRKALVRGVPVLAICRGFQELNVALGGSLHQAVHAVPGMQDHRENKAATLDHQYAPAHPVRVEADGRLAQILESDADLLVNSLHGQGIDRLAHGLHVEATAPDGLVEAYSVRNAPGFTLAVQWHPEWRVTENPASMRIFQAFGAACRAYQQQRGGL